MVESKVAFSKWNILKGPKPLVMGCIHGEKLNRNSSSSDILPILGWMSIAGSTGSSVDLKP